MAHAQNFPNPPSSERNMALKRISPSHEGLTPPDSPTKGTAASQAIVKDLKHLFGVFLGMVRQVLECASSRSGEDGFDLKHPICTTPEDFQSFEKWASTPKFKTVKETYVTS